MVRTVAVLILFVSLAAFALAQQPVGPQLPEALPEFSGTADLKMDPEPEPQPDPKAVDPALRPIAKIPPERGVITLTLTADTQQIADAMIKAYAHRLGWRVNMAAKPEEFVSKRLESDLLEFLSQVVRAQQQLKSQQLHDQ